MSFVKAKTNDLYPLRAAEADLARAQERLRGAKQACDAIIERARKAGIAEGALW